MESETIHVHTEKLQSNLHVFLLFIPAVVFVAVLIFLSMKTPSRFAATSTVPDVLGDEVQK